MDSADPRRGPPQSTALYEIAGPTLVNTGGHGFEPSIGIAPDGTIYVAAAKGLASGEPGAVSSLLWFSSDDGDSWEPMQSPLNARDKLYGIEGDVAIDNHGTVWYVDSYAADNVLTRWDSSRSWEWTRPFQGTAAADDRPWLEAQGDGTLYYLGNTVAPARGANTLDPDPFAGARIWMYTSDDGGLSWSVGYGFVRSGYCTMDAPRDDPGRVEVICTHGVADDAQVWAYRSHDSGSTFEETVLADYAGDPVGSEWATITAMSDGGALAAWVDGGTAGPSRGIAVAQQTGEGAWTKQNLRPFDGTYSHVWAAASPREVAVVFYATTDTAPASDSPWYVYAMIQGSIGPAGAWTTIQLDDEPVSVGDSAPVDFFQAAYGPDGALHVAYQRDGVRDSTLPGIKPDRADVLHVAVRGAPRTPPA